jgi:hypothetical protein
MSPFQQALLAYLARLTSAVIVLTFSADLALGLRLANPHPFPTH